MGYEDIANVEYDRDPDRDPLRPWRVRKKDGTGEMWLSDTDALYLAGGLEYHTPVDPPTFPPERWDDHPHLRGVAKAAWCVRGPRDTGDHDRYAAELVASLGRQHLAVMACESRQAARRGDTSLPQWHVRDDTGREYRLVPVDETGERSG